MAGASAGKAEYTVEDRQIVGRSVANTGTRSSAVQRDYADFILELEFKVQKSLNSGVQIRSHCFDRPQTVKLGDKSISIPGPPSARLPGEIICPTERGPAGFTTKDAAVGSTTSRKRASSKGL